MTAVKLICVGKMKEKFFIDAFREYEKRLSGYCSFSCVELSEQRLSDDPSPAEIEAALDREAAEIIKNIPKDALVVALCIEGTEISSPALAEKLRSWENSGRSRLCFVIGSSCGLSERVKSLAALRLSMSPMTFPHHLARVMLAEQLYRAYKINEGSRYHK